MLSIKRKSFEASPATQRVFLYMQPQAVSYPTPEDENTYIEIELEHRSCVITKLGDHYSPENKIHLKSFDTEKPTFSITIEQDSYDDIGAFSDAPLTLTLYEHYIPELSLSESTVIQPPHRKMEDRWPLAQGYIDMMQFFNKWRYKVTVDVFLYPLRPSNGMKTCKMSWDVYALMPVVKHLTCSNAIFITFMSLQSVEDSLLYNCDDLVATISWQCKEPIEFTSKYHKVFICKYTAFTRQLVSNNTTSCKWENMKNPSLQNYECVGIYSDINLNLFSTISKLLVPEDSEFSFPDIEADVDFNLVCDSMHRYILTDTMHRQLERHVANDKLHLTVEIFRESDPTNVLLQGFIDLSIFMYPEINNCSFAVKMTPPPTYRASSSITETMSSINTSLSNITPAFAIVRICIKTPITQPPRDFFTSEMTDSIYRNCWPIKGLKMALGSNDEKYERSYREFDNTIYDLINYIVKNNLYNTIGQDSFSEQVSNVANSVLPLLAYDFNIRFPTETNREFANLMTTVYEKLVTRVHHLLMKDAEVNITYTDMQEGLIFLINAAKLMYEVENMDMYQYLFDQFIFDVELGKYDSAREYLKLPYSERDLGGELFTAIIEIYINYMEGLNSKEQTADENLLIALNEFCENIQPKNQIGWILLFCLYKRHKYRPGMEYSRWKYDNLFRHRILAIKYIPTSRWDMFNNFTPKLTSTRGQYFWKAVEVLLDIGLYGFAAWIFDEIADECSDIENTYKYEVGILRYGYRMIRMKKLENAVRAFNFFGTEKRLPAITYVGKAIALYYSGRLKEAETYFIQAAGHRMYFPDVWAYLALINLKLGEYKKALECWKYARLNPNTLIHKEILKELGNVDFDRIDILATMLED
uniref:Tetratricopeptide repeat protein 18 n=1 Tax=Glossina brevipalpis TaxID=37001 RepID=A0A1A9W432_9MUSC